MSTHPFTDPVTGIVHKARDIWPEATMIVEFMDGATRTIPKVRFLAIRGFSDPVIVNGTTVSVESKDETLTMVGVRCFGWDHS